MKVYQFFCEMLIFVPSVTPYYHEKMTIPSTSYKIKKNHLILIIMPISITEWQFAYPISYLLFNISN